MAVEVHPTTTGVRAMSRQTRTKPARRPARRLRKLTLWIAALGTAAALVYVVSENAGVPYDDHDIVVVDFSSLSSAAKKSALQEANRTRCTCTCGMTLAQCVATDSTCPIRTDNIEKIKTMVRQAATTGT